MFGDSIYLALFYKLTGKTIFVFGNQNPLSRIFDALITIIVLYLLFKYLKPKKLSGLLTKNWIIVSLLFLFSFVLRLVFINDGLYHHDSIRLAVAVKESSLFNIEPTVGGKHLFVWINYIFYNLLPFKEEFLFNFVTILFAAASVVAMFYLVNELANRKVAIFSSLLLALSPVYFSATTFAKSHSTAIFFSILSLFFFYKYIKNQKLFLGIISIILFLASLLIRIDSMFFLIPILLFYWKERKGLRKIGESLYFLLAFILISVMFSSSLIYHAKANPYTSDWTIFLISINNLIDSITLIGLILLFYFFATKNHRLIYFIWILIPLVILGGMRNPSPRILIPILIPVFIVIALSLDKLSFRKSGSLLISIILIMFLYSYPILDYRHNNSGPKEYALAIKEITPPSAVIISNDDAPFIDYYANRETIGFPIWGDKNQIGEAVTNIIFLIDNGAPVYVDHKLINWAGTKSLNQTLEFNFELLNVGSVLTEDYHSSTLMLRVFNDDIYQLKKKENFDINEIRISTYKN